MGRLLDGIRNSGVYRAPFIEYMEAHLVEPRQSAWDKVYEWARGYEAERTGMPGCACMRNTVMRFEGEWRNLTKGVDASGERYGGIPAPAREGGLLGRGRRKPSPAPKPKPSPAPKPKGDPIVAAIRSLDTDDRSLWTRSGKPRVSAVEDVLGRDITAAERDKAWAAVQAQPAPTPAPLPRKPPPPVSPPPPSDQMLAAIKAERRDVTAKQVAEAIQGSTLSALRPSLLDSKYTALPLEVWQAILEWSDVDRMAYIAEQRDCDNFAVALAGQVGLRLGVNGCGIVVDYSGQHAYCCILVAEADGDLVPLLVEPQSDSMPQVGDRIGRNEAYKATNGWILFA